MYVRGSGLKEGGLLQGFTSLKTKTLQQKIMYL